LKTGSIGLTDKKQISKILNRNNYLIVFVIIGCLIINYDLFSSKPKFLVTEGYLWKGLAIIFQLTFIGNLIRWELKKQKIINILSNGNLVNSKLKMSEQIKPNNSSSYYLHLFKYTVGDENFEVVMKNKNSKVKSNFIIYEKGKPKNAVVFEDLKKGLKKMVKNELK